MYGLITGFNVDYGTEIFNLMKRSVLTKTGMITSHLPYPRFWSIIIAKAFEDRNVELPISENIWKSPIMKPWCATQGWTSNKDVPILPESMLCLIAEDSPYRRLHEEILDKEEEQIEVFDSSSSPEDDDQISVAPETYET
ncbi:hypothetical protein Hanom_Chr16g01478771 [Helianthus anomalus]